MISSKIDLTENHDFSLTNTLQSLDIRVDYDATTMSLDAYDKIIEHERIFGQRRHVSEVSKIFKNNNDKYKIDKYCKRCGKLLKIPWKIQWGLCENCNYILENTNYENKRIAPWKESYRNNSFRVIDSRDVLHLK